MRYLTGRGNVRCAMHLLRQISVGHLSGRGSVRRGYVWSGKCPSGMCLVGEMSAWDVSGRGNVHRGCVWSGKCLSGKCLSGKSPSEKCLPGMCPGIPCNTNDKARPDIRARGMWRPGQNAFSDICLTNVNANSQKHQIVDNILKKHEKEKKRAYNNRIMNVEHWTFTQLVFSLTGVEGPETSTFHKHISQKYCEKSEEKHKKVLSFTRCKLSFLILRSVLICVRGS